MAELTIRPDEIRAALDSFVKSYEPTGVVTEEVGRVTLTADGIAQVEGLPGAMANELLRFEDGTLGLVGDLAAARRERLVAAVTSGSELSQAQLDRLGGILQQAYGQELQLNVTVDPEILGGLRIQVGADVVDSTVLARLADARRRLAS